MRGKYWPDHLNVLHVEIGGVCWLLGHLRSRTQTLVVPAAEGHPSVTLTLQVEYSSHCVSAGAKQSQMIDFHAVGYERLIIDHRKVRRVFHAGRHALSFLLPDIIASIADRRCFFTGRENFLTLELGNTTPGQAAEMRYEIYFNVRKGEGKNTLKLFIESAYVRDEDADNRPVNFKKADKIRAWKLFLNTARGASIKAARNSALNMRKKGRV